MINTQVRIHDKFSVEFKIGFVTENKSQDVNDFKINTWIFLPNGLDVNKITYSKEQFYADVKSNIRLITPVHSLSDILNGDEHFPRLNRAIKALLDEPNEINEENYVYRTKMLLCIIKSALRDFSKSIEEQADESTLKELVEQFANDVGGINTQYRIMRDNLLKDQTLTEEQKEYFLFGDEFLGNITELTTYQIMSKLNNREIYTKLKPQLRGLIDKEDDNKREMGYNLPIEGDDELNSLILIKRSLLKKFVESDLYLQRVKKADGAFVRQFYYSFAAGVAMFFATVVSFFATKQFGNFTTSLFVVLVLSYMLKDKIKEVSRFYFSSKLDRKYFDRKWKVSIRNQEIGWIKEGFDYMKEEKVPAEILELRNKTSLVKAENKVYDEKIILFRKWVSLSKKDIEKNKEYQLSGINDITRLNLMSFIRKMDNPVVPIYLPDEENGFKTIMGNRVYALYFIVQCESEGDMYYKKYRLLFNRNGINDVSELDK